MEVDWISWTCSWWAALDKGQTAVPCLEPWVKNEDFGVTLLGSNAEAITNYLISVPYSPHQ